MHACIFVVIAVVVVVVVLSFATVCYDLDYVLVIDNDKTLR